MSDRHNIVHSSCLIRMQASCYAILKFSESKSIRKRNTKLTSHLIYGFDKHLNPSSCAENRLFPSHARLKLLNLVQREKKVRCETQRTTRRMGTSAVGSGEGKKTSPHWNMGDPARTRDNGRHMSTPSGRFPVPAVQHLCRRIQINYKLVIKSRSRHDHFEIKESCSRCYLNTQISALETLETTLT